MWGGGARHNDGRLFAGGRVPELPVAVGDVPTSCDLHDERGAERHHESNPIEGSVEDKWGSGIKRVYSHPVAGGGTPPDPPDGDERETALRCIR